MNILVIGNGFDIAHGLPTKYSDFLAFIDIFRTCFRDNKFIECQSFSTDEKYKNLYNYLLELNNNEKALTSDFVTEFKTMEENNKWVEHFKNTQLNENWVDFEKEISRLVKMLDDVRPIAKEHMISDTQLLFRQYQKELKLFDESSESNLTLKKISNMKTLMLNDLNRLTRALELYLSEFVAEINLEGKSLEDIRIINPDIVISFNYTETYDKLYNVSKDLRSGENIDYIHGKAKKLSNINDCNLVLGIDEYLSDGRENSDNEFIEFKKFYQRIYKMTGIKYRGWLEINKNIAQDVNIFFYGHSIDFTDKDIIKDLISRPRTKTTIFYHNKDAFGKQIANLVKIIGEEELIERTGERNPSIEFKPTKK